MKKKDKETRDLDQTEFMAQLQFTECYVGDHTAFDKLCLQPQIQSEMRMVSDSCTYLWNVISASTIRK